MVSIKIPNTKDLNALINFLKEHNINYVGIKDKLWNSMIIEYDNSIIGFANYKLVKGIAILENLLIHKRYRNQHFGDGLVKALLNLADKRGINKIYCLTPKECSEFFLKLGFIKEANISEELIKIFDGLYNLGEMDIYYANLSDFFNNKCKHK